MKKIIFGLGLSLAGLFASAQNGLEGIIVEKYYVSNAADAAGSSAAGAGNLPVGSVTYRIYADMLPGYKVQALFGTPTHTLQLSSSTSFYNNELGGLPTGNVPFAQLKNDTRALDSWFSVGSAATGNNYGVLKTEDNGLANLLPIASNPLLKNVDPTAGIALSVQDGIIAGATAPQAVTFVGLSLGVANELDVFDALNVSGSLGNLFTTTNGSIAALAGASGPIPATNRILLGQFTTDGVFSFELNLQIGTPTGGTEQYVALNPVGAEISIPSMKGTFGAANAAPIATLTAPAASVNVTTGTLVALAATATDADGTVASVEFFAGATSLGVDNTAPFTASYTAAAGTVAITARATDNLGLVGPASTQTVSVTGAADPAPTVALTAPTVAANVLVGSAIAISANASDNGSVASVEFFVNGVSVGLDNTAPYTATANAIAGANSITARATDNIGQQSTTAAVVITGTVNAAPVVSITAPLASATFTAPAVVAISANAVDPDGTIASVEFFVNGVSVGTDATAPYTATWTSVIGNASFTARATDNNGAQTTSSAVVLAIADPNALPYKVATLKNSCSSPSFCLPVIAVDSVKTVNGYDIVMAYNKNKITPTGVINKTAGLYSVNNVDIINSIDATNGLINISVFFNGTAPANSVFFGKGELFCVEFSKTAAFTSVDTAAVSINSLQESFYSIPVANKLAEAGKYITFKDSVFTANLQFWSNNSPIKYDPLNPTANLITNIYGTNAACGAKSTVAVQPNLTGNFVYNVNNGVNVSIEKDIVGSTDVQPVINGADAFLARRVLLNDASFVPSIYQVIAMDVNLDGVISAGDISQINLRTVLKQPDFKQLGLAGKDWLFVDLARVSANVAYKISTTYPANDGIGYSKSRVPQVPFCLPVPIANGAICPVISSETYQGILLGDVNGNFATVSPNSAFRTASTDKVVFDFSKAIVKNGTVDVPVSITSASDVNALDLAIELKNTNLTFNSIVKHDANLQAEAFFNADDNKLRFTSNSMNKYEMNKAIISVRFDLNGGNFNEADLNAITGYVNGDKAALKVIGSSANASIVENSIEVYPNPSNGLVNVSVSEDATVQILDLNGKQVVLQADVKANVKSEMNVSDLANGIYVIKIANDNFVSTKKLVIKK